MTPVFCLALTSFAFLGAKELTEVRVTEEGWSQLGGRGGAHVQTCGLMGLYAYIYMCPTHHPFCITPTHVLHDISPSRTPSLHNRRRKTSQPLKHLIPPFILLGKSEKSKTIPFLSLSPSASLFTLVFEIFPLKLLGAATPHTFPSIGEAPGTASPLQKTETNANHIGASHGAHSAMNSQGQNHSGVIKNINVAYQAAGKKL